MTTTTNFGHGISFDYDAEVVRMSIDSVTKTFGDFADLTDIAGALRAASRREYSTTNDATFQIPNVVICRAGSRVEIGMGRNVIVVSLRTAMNIADAVDAAKMPLSPN